jgi:hypothetical protein
LEQAPTQLKVEKDTESQITQQLLEDKERVIKEKELLISKLKKQLAEIKTNAPAKLEAECRKRQSENVHSILSPEQLELFRLLSHDEKSYAEILETACINKLDIHDMPFLRVQISRLNKNFSRQLIIRLRECKRMMSSIIR